MARRKNSNNISQERFNEYLSAIDAGLNPPVEPAGPGMGALRQAESEIPAAPSIGQAFTPDSMGQFRQIEGTTPLPIAGMDYEVPPPPIDTSTIGMEEVSFAPSRAQRIANMSDFGKAFDRGAAGVFGSMGGSLRMLGMEDTGRAIADNMDRVTEEIPQTTGELNLQKNPFTLDPANIGHIFTPEFWNDGRLVASFANAAGSSAPFLVGSMIAAVSAPVTGSVLTTAAITRIGQAALSTQVGRATIGKIVTNPLAQKAFQNTIGRLGDVGKAFVAARVASSIPEAMTEGGGAYNEMAKWNEAVSIMRDPNIQDKSAAKETLKKMYEQNGGKGELDTDHAPTIDDAKWRAWKQTILNMPLLAVSNAVEAVNILSPAKNIITGTARKMAFGAAQGSGEEFGQEGASYGVPGVGTHGTPFQGEEFVWSLDPRKWNANTRNAVAGGGMFGGVMGAMGGGAGPSKQNIPAQTQTPAEQPKLKIGDVLPDDEFGPVTFSGLAPDGQAVFSTENGTQITMPVPVEYIDPSALGKTTESPGTAPLPTENNPAPANPANKAPEAANSLASDDGGNVFSNGWKLGEGIRNGTATGPLAEVQNTLNNLRQQPMEMDQAMIVSEELLSGLSDKELIALLDGEAFGDVIKGEPAMARDERTVPNLPAIEWNRRYPSGHAAAASATSDKPKSKTEALKLATDDLAAAKRRYGANPTDAQRRSLERKQKEVDEINGLDDWGQTNTITSAPAVSPISESTPGSFAVGDKVTSSKGSGVVNIVTKSGVGVKTADGKKFSVSWDNVEKFGLKKENITSDNPAPIEKPQHEVKSDKIKIGDTVTRPGKNDGFVVVDDSDQSLFSVKTPRGGVIKTGKAGVVKAGSESDVTPVSNDTDAETHYQNWKKDMVRAIEREKEEDWSNRPSGILSPTEVLQNPSFSRDGYMERFEQEQSPKKAEAIPAPKKDEIADEDRANKENAAEPEVAVEAKTSTPSSKVPLTKHYFYRHSDGYDIVPDAVAVKNDYGIDAFSHKSRNGKTYAVSDAKSGMSIINDAPTRKAAVDDFHFIMEGKNEKVHAAIAKSPASPRYDAELLSKYQDKIDEHEKFKTAEKEQKETAKGGFNSRYHVWSTTTSQWSAKNNGKPVDLAFGIKGFIANNKGDFSVVELATGLRLGRGSTEESAVKSAATTVENNKATLNATIAAALNRAEQSRPFSLPVGYAETLANIPTPETKQPEKAEALPIDKTVRVGDKVTVSGEKGEATVTRVSGQDIVVDMDTVGITGTKTTTVSVGEVEKVAKQPEKAEDSPIDKKEEKSDNVVEETSTSFGSSDKQKLKDTLMAFRKPKKLVNVIDSSPDALAAYERELKAELDKIGVNPIFNPTLMGAALKLGLAHTQNGVNNFAEWSAKMISSVGDRIKPYLPSSWQMINGFPEGEKFNADMVNALFEYSGVVYEEGNTEIDAFTKAITDDLGEEFEPYVKMAYEGIISWKGGSTNAIDGKQGEVRPVGETRSEDIHEAVGRGRTGKPDGNKNDSVLGTQPATDVSEAEGVGSPGTDGIRSVEQNTGRGENVPENGNVLPGRAPVSGGGMATEGTGTGGRGTGIQESGEQPVGATGPVTGGVGSDAQGRGPVVSPEIKEAQRPNYHIDNPEQLIGGTPKVRFARNKAAIEAFLSISAENRAPSKEELDSMASYIGWGSFGQELFQGNWTTPKPKAGWEKEDAWMREHLGKEEWESSQRSIINAHYTDPITVKAMWDIVQKMGFQGGRILEPSMGVGNFFGLMPLGVMENSSLTGIELDKLTGGMAQLLYPNANIQIKGYQESQTADNFYDLVIGNFPFASQSPADRRYLSLSPTLHDFFYLKGLDQVRPGGLVVAITSAGTMDKTGKSVRIELAKKAELVAAYRLPSGAFEKYAGTSVVTDVLVFRKREIPLTDISGEAWINTDETRVPHGRVKVNQYYIDNPSHILGTLDYGHGTTSGRPGMIVNRPDELQSMVETLHSKFEAGTYSATQQHRNISYVSNNIGDRHGSVVVDKKGNLMVSLGEVMAPANEIKKYAIKSEKDTQAREDQIKRLVGIRKAYGATIDAERANEPETEELRKKLKQQYLDFVGKHGAIENSYGLKYLDKLGDPFAPLLKALERDGKPAEVLERKTVRSIKNIDKPTIEEAFVIARNQSMFVDLSAVAKAANTTEEEVAKKLIDLGQIIKTPAGNYETTDQYLSGNVRVKMRQAQEALAAGDTDMSVNIEAINAVMPETIPYYKIEARLGAPWVGAGNYKLFVSELLGVKNTDGIEISNVGGPYKVNFTDRTHNNRTEATNINGVDFYPFDKLVTHAFNNAAIVIKYTDPETKAVTILEEESAQANEKAAQVREIFTQWVWKDSARKIELETNYNEVMNAIATPRYDGSFLQFPGMALLRGESEFSLREHQVNAIWRGLANNRGIYGHEVGTGKTFTMVGIAVESRRLGIARKPILFAHNSNSASVAADANVMYPGAKVLYIESLGKKNVKTEMNRIATEDWDLIVVPHSLIDNFCLSEQTLMSIAADEIANLEDAALTAAADDNITLTLEMMDEPDAVSSLRSQTAKDLVKQRNKIIEKIKKQALAASSEGAVTFENLGIDQILVDEAHIFKKPPLSTKMKMKGLATSTSDRSLSLFFLTQYVKQKNNGAGVHVFTGTPITNSLVEIYNMMRYVMDSEMQKTGVKDWDSWFASFADSDTDIELTTTGEYEPVTRLSQFVNTAELRQMAGQYMDIVFADAMPEFKPRETATGKTNTDELTPGEKDELHNGRSENPKGRPYKKIINDFSDMTPPQRKILEILVGRANHFKQASKLERYKIMKQGRPESPVIVETDASNAGVDARLFDMSEKDYKESKVNRVIGNVLSIYKGSPVATQVIFMQRGLSDYKTKTERDSAGNKTEIKLPALNLSKEIVAKLVSEGVPKEEIAIVSGSTSKEKRKEIADEMNRSKIRVVIGTTETLGVGVNMQENLRAMHHMDAPWMPGDLEQRNGRGHRQGNKWNTVLEYRYLTNKLDGRRWQVLAIKARFIRAFLTADSSVRIIEGDAVDLNETDDISATMAEATGDPRRMQANKLKNDVTKLERRERNYLYGMADAREKIKQLKEDNKTAKQSVANAEADVKTLEKTKDAEFSFKIGESVLTDRDVVTESIQDAGKKVMIDRNLDGGQRQYFGSYKGFKLYFVKSFFASTMPKVEIQGSGTYDAFASLGSVEHGVRAIKNTIIRGNQTIADNKESIVKLEKVLADPFYQQETLDRKKKQLADLEADLLRNPNPLPGWVSDTAPVGSEVYVKGKPHVVEGHKEINGEYWVIADGSVYMASEVNDENGMPLYADQLPSKPQKTETKLAEGEYGAAEVAHISDPDYTKSDSVYYYSGIDPFQLIPGLRKYSDMTAKEAFADLVAIGRKVYAETTHGGKWMARMRELLGNVWAKAKGVMMKVWNEVKRVLKDNRGAIRLGGQRIEASAVVVPADTETGGRKTVEQLVENGWMSRTAQDGSSVLVRPQAKPREVPDSFTPAIPGMDRNVAFEFEQSSEVPEIPTGEKLRDSMKKFWAYASRKYSTLPRSAEFAPLEFGLTQLEHKKGVATDTTVKTIQGIVSTLKNKKDYQIFSHKVVFDDIAADLEADPEYKMPFGLTQENFQEQYDAVNAAVTPEIQQAIDARKEAWNDFKEKYVASMKAIGFNVEDRLKKGDTYFHHIVLDYAELKKRLDPVLGTQIRTPSYRGFLKSREGSTKNILTDYLQPEMEVMGQMMYDVEIAKVIKLVSDKYDIQSDLKKIATASNEFNTIKSLIDEKGEIDGVKSWNQLSKKQAMAMSRLAELAFNDELPNNGKFDDVLDALTEAHSSGEQLELPKNRLFAYLTYLMNADSDAGKMAAGLMFKGIKEKAAAIKERLGDEHLSWRDLIPEGYEPWQPREGNIFYTGYTIPEHIAQGIAEKAVSELGVPADKVRRVMLQGGKRREMVVPVEVASTLEEIVPARAYQRWILNFLTKLQGKWKQAVLQMPNRFLSYNFNNMVGDLDAVIAAQGHKAMRKTMTAARELYGVFYRGKEMSPSMKEWFNRGGFETLLQTQEAGKVNQLATFDRLMERERKLSKLPLKVWQSYWHGARKATDFREAIMRYAKFLDYVEQMNGTGVPNEFGASDPQSVMALDNEYDRAFKLSNELLGAYDSISEMGRDMRSFIWPFWSWKEVNATRYAQMIKNATADSKTAQDVAIAVGGQALRRAPYAAVKAGAFMVKATFLWALIQTYNWWMWPEEEKDLEDGVKYKMHIILGRDQDGKVRYVKASGAFADLLGWVSLDTPMQHYDSWLSGRKSLQQIAIDMANAPVNITLSGATPYFKVAGELIWGKSVFPDWRKPRPIRDKGLYLASTVALGNEYRAAFGLPSRPYTPIDWSMVKKSDPLQAAYYSFMSTKQRFMEEKGKGEGFFNSPKSEALRNYKEALRYQDEQAAVKYLEQYKLAGGTREGLERSMESMNPTAGLKVSERKEFLASLNPEERRKMNMAQQYFDMVIARSGGALSVTKKGVIDVKLKGVDLPSEKKPKKQNFF